MVSASGIMTLSSANSRFRSKSDGRCACLVYVALDAVVVDTQYAVLLVHHH